MFVGLYLQFEQSFCIYNLNKVFLQTSLEKNSINSSYISILSMNFENLIVRLHVLIIFFIPAESSKMC